jgi:hypothetical protein
MAETHDDLQNILNKFGEYCNTWKWKANTDKTKVIVFSLPLFKNSNIAFVAFSACFLIALLKFPVLLNNITR